MNRVLLTLAAAGALLFLISPAAIATEPKADPLAVPEGTTADLMKFLENIRQVRQEAQQQYQKAVDAARQEYSQASAKASGAEVEAANKILDQKPDRSSEAYQTAMGIVLPDRVRNLAGASVEDQRAVVDALREHLAGKKAALEYADLTLARSAAGALENAGSQELAIEAYRSFAELLTKSSDARTRAYAATFLGTAKRLGLLGHELEVQGTMLDGRALDWSNLRGKTVLVDFWATWCGPCRSEIEGNLMSCYKQYHDRGFEVVAISLDADREALEKYVEEKRIPWIIVHEKELRGRHPLATEYGISAIPTVLLVDKEGKVVSLRARGDELRRLLENALGPPLAPSGKLSHIDLLRWANQGLKETMHTGGPGRNTLEELPQGEQEFGGITFLVGQKLIHLGSQKVENRPLRADGISIDRKCLRFYFLHAAAFYDYSSLTGKSLGSYVVHYDDGTTEAIPIIAGQDILNWFRIPSSLTATRAVVGWEGENPMTREGKWEPYRIYLYVGRWDNPQKDKLVRTIDFVSANTDAAPFCVAITAEE